MYISKLEIFGFKSFAQKTVLEFDKGITSIVGPNGCGKTNIVDAIRWVMGEQRTTLLRSGKMADIIFAGSKTRKQLNYAEVALTIHNNDGVLSVAYEDVVVCRRLYRDGTSEYLLNDTPVRLKDINDLFVDTGLSTNAYSVIELKMIEEILNVDKVHRKLLFEEAAGINKYKSQRKSSFRKLDSTREDLERLNDIVFEIEKNIRTLKRQLKRYEKYEEYSEELKKIEIQYAQIKYKKLDEQIVPLEKQLSENKLQKEDTGKQLTIEEQMLVEYRKSLEELENKSLEISIKVNEFKEKINNNNSQILVLDEKTQNANSNISRLEKERSDAFSRIIANEKIRDELSKQLTKNDPQIQLLKTQNDEKQKKYKEIEKEYKKADNYLEKIQKEKIDKNRKIAELNQKRNRLIDQKENYIQLIDEQAKQNDELEKEVSQSKKNKEKFTKEKLEIDDKIKDVQEKLISFENERKSINENIDLQKDEINKFKSHLDKDKNEMEFLTGLIESNSGYSSGVKYVIQTIKTPAVLGTVSNLIEVKEKYANAIEAGIGDVAGCLVVETKKVALEIVERVKKNKRGRLTIIPLDIISQFVSKAVKGQSKLSNLFSMKAKVPKPEKYDKKDSNIIGYAKDFIKYDKKVKILVDYLLNDLLVVKSLEKIPTELLNEHKFCFVTLDGDYLNRVGFVKGGTGAKFQNLVGRTERINALKRSIKIIQDEIDIVNTKLEKEQQTRLLIAEEVDKTTIESKKLNNTRNEIENKLNKADFSIEQYNKSFGNVEEKISTYSYKIQDIEKILSELSVENENEEISVAEIEEKFTDATKKYDEISKIKDNYFQKAQEKKIQLITIEREKETTNFRFQNAIDTIRELSSRIEIISKEFISFKEIIQDGDDRQKELKINSEELEKELKIVKENESTVREKLIEKKKQLYKVENSIAEKHKNQENVYQNLRDIEIKLNEMKSEQKQAIEKIKDRYRIDILKKELIISSLSEAEMLIKIKKITNQIELIGPVNMAIKTEYEEETTRLKFIQEQKQDLVDAEKSIVETIDKLDKEARQKFTKTFAKIKQNYVKTYNMFFPNGSCDLKLVGDADPLEADIEIFSRPKGKEMKSIRALSGGEKALTAIALLFAIYLVKPSPYCILDEIDAPLDDLNVGRFTDALAHFTDRTQFIIVTHNKSTMKVAKSLYGVTMQEEGVSKIVSVQFNKNNKREEL